MPSLVRRTLSLLRAPVNEAGFALRSRLRWRRGRPVPANESKADMFGWLADAERAAAELRAGELAAEFDLGGLAAASSRLVFAENLALLDRLEALGGDLELAGEGAELAAVDVGCGSFQYATALQRWLAGRTAAPTVRLRGIEIDGYGIYRDGHSRADHAAAHAELAGPGVSFEVADLLRAKLPPQDVVTLFFPFLTAFSLLQWGSPLSHLKPRRCLRRAVEVLRPGGVLVVVNQTEAEFVRVRHVLAELPVALIRRAGFATPLVPYFERTAGRIGSLWRRNALPAAPPTR